MRLFLALVAVSTTALFAAATPSEAGQPPFAASAQTFRSATGPRLCGRTILEHDIGYRSSR